MSSDSTSSTADRLGVFASSACALHCLAAAMLPTVLAAVGLSALLGHEAEWAFTLAAVAIAGFALAGAWRRLGLSSPVVLLALGMAGLLAARGLEDAGGHMLGTSIAVMSGALLVFGHLQNIRAMRRAQDPCCVPG